MKMPSADDSQGTNEVMDEDEDSLSPSDTVVQSPVECEYPGGDHAVSMNTNEYANQQGGEMLQCFSESALTGINFSFDDMLCTPEWALDNEVMCGF